MARMLGVAAPERFLEKPFDIGDVLEAIAQAMAA